MLDLAPVPTQGAAYEKHLLGLLAMGRGSCNHGTVWRVHLDRARREKAFLGSRHVLLHAPLACTGLSLHCFNQVGHPTRG